MNHIGIHALVWAEGWSELGATCSFGLSFEADVSSEDGENRRRGEEVLRAAVRTASELGSAFLGGVVYSAMGKYLPHALRRRRERVARSLGNNLIAVAPARVASTTSVAV
jgi:hypothetical protein